MCINYGLSGLLLNMNCSVFRRVMFVVSTFVFFVSFCVVVVFIVFLCFIFFLNLL